MKTTIKVLLLSIAAATPCVVLAETAQASMPLVANAQSALAFYVILAFGFMIAAEYSRGSRMLFGTTKRRVAKTETSEVRPCRRSNAYSIRRPAQPRACASV